MEINFGYLTLESFLPAVASVLTDTPRVTNRPSNPQNLCSNKEEKWNTPCWNTFPLDFGRAVGANIISLDKEPEQAAEVSDTPWQYEAFRKDKHHFGEYKSIAFQILQLLFSSRHPWLRTHYWFLMKYAIRAWRGSQRNFGWLLKGNKKNE